MEFALPDHLKMAVAQYDPVLKASLIAERKRNQPSKKSRFPLGQPVGLFPAEILDAKQEAEMVAQINAANAEDRCKITRNGEDVCALVYHESLWMAIWTTANKDADYFYGFKCAWKSAPSVERKVTALYTKAASSERFQMKDQPVEVKYGKTGFYTWGKVITHAMVLDGHIHLPWNQWLDRWGKYSREKYNTVENTIVGTLKTRLPIWTDSSSIFDRLVLGSNPSKIAFDAYYEKDLEWTEETLVKKLELPARIMDTPFFRREVRNVLTRVQSAANDPEVTIKAEVVRPWKYLQHQCRFVGRFLEFYPDASLDHVQQMYRNGRIIDAPWTNGDEVHAWVRKNIPIGSWINLFTVFYDSKLPEHTDGGRYGSVNTFSFRDLNDTINMMRTVLDHNGGDYTGRPDRWRIADLHDHFVQESFKVSNKDEPLRQDLFPAPIKVTHLGSKWTFFQPNSVHQLAQWGAAVRNCVGSASSYREGIKRKTHFIVLAMIDNKPQFTVQARVRNGVLTIDQIAGISNRHLTPDERSSYELTLAAAINKQNNILAEGAAMN